MQYWKVITKDISNIVINNIEIIVINNKEIDKKQ